MCKLIKPLLCCSCSNCIKVMCCGCCFVSKNIGVDGLLWLFDQATSCSHIKTPVWIGINPCAVVVLCYCFVAVCHKDLLSFSYCDTRISSVVHTDCTQEQWLHKKSQKCLLLPPLRLMMLCSCSDKNVRFVKQWHSATMRWGINKSSTTTPIIRHHHQHYRPHHHSSSQHHHHSSLIIIISSSHHLLLRHPPSHQSSIIPHNKNW